MSQEKRYSLTEHLRELQRRLTRSLIALAITTVISFVFTRRIFEILMRPIPGVPLVYTEVTEMIGVYFKVALMTGLILALPYLLYEILMFVAPGLKPKEKRYVFYLLPGVFFMFAAGAVFSYFVLIPPAMRFLFTFGSDIAQPFVRIANYISVLTRLIFWIGMVFEMPLVFFLLAKIGLVSSRTLARGRRLAVVGAFVLGAIITPTFDPINQTLVALPIMALYEASIWLAKLARPPSPKVATAPSSS